MKFPPLAPLNGSGGPAFLSGWDFASIGGRQVPGKAKILGGKIKLKHDKKSKAGVNGSRPTTHGLDPQEFELEVDVWTQDQIELLGDLCRLILPQQTSTPLPMALVHPDVQHLGPMNVIVLGAGSPRREGCHRIYTFYLAHWMPPQGPPATLTATRSVRNLRSEAAAKANPPNPDPTTLPGAFAPPMPNP